MTEASSSTQYQLLLSFQKHRSHLWRAEYNSGLWAWEFVASFCRHDDFSWNALTS